MDEVILTRHFQKRCKTRKGIKKGNCRQERYIIKLADSNNFLAYKDLSGSIKVYVDRIIDISRYHPIITKDSMFIVSNDNAYVTVYFLPKEYHGKVLSLLKRKKEGIIDAQRQAH